MKMIVSKAPRAVRYRSLLCAFGRIALLLMTVVSSSSTGTKALPPKMSPKASWWSPLRTAGLREPPDD